MASRAVFGAFLKKGDCFMDKFLNKLERKIGRYAIPDLMKYICILYCAGLVINIANPAFYYNWLSLNPPMILQGQVWRLVTFLIQPPNTSLIFFIFTLYLYYMLGQTLERTWGAFRFNVYYFSGVIFTIIGAFAAYFVTGSVYLLDTYYINMSLFLAFAFIYPDVELLLMFLIPVKIKWLAYLDMAFFAYSFFIGNFGTKISVALAILNFVIFFFGFMRTHVGGAKARMQHIRRQTVRKPAGQTQARVIHKCAVCGRDSNSHPELEFRYCSKCNGNYEYCQDHLFTHEHVQ